MNKLARFNLRFIAGCVGAFILLCIATAFGMIRVIGWYLSNCGSSTTCSAAEWLISYWWLLFVPGTLLCTFLLRRVYDSRYAQLKAQG